MEPDEVKQNYVTASEAAEILKITRNRVGRLCLGGRFQGAFRMGRSWLIPREAVMNHTKLKPGPKPKSARREEDKALLKAALEEAERSKSGA